MISHKLSRDDVDDLATLHQDAFPDFFLSRLGIPFLRLLYCGFVEDDSVIAALERDADGIPRAVALGTTEPARFFSRILMRRLPGFILESLRVAVRNPLTAPRLFRALRYRGDSVDGGGALLSTICVAREVQGRGLGGKLIRAWEDQARSMGATQAYLTTDADNNNSVNAAYRRWGWVLVEEYSTREGRRMNRYAKSLASGGLEAEPE